MNGSEREEGNISSWRGMVWMKRVFRRRGWLVLSLKGGVGYLYKEVAKNESVQKKKNE